jgi:hypothetical protein
MMMIVFMGCVGVLIWSYFKKSYTRKIYSTEIKSLKQSSVNSSVFYLKLHNGKQRNLIEIKNEGSAIELLDMLRVHNGLIGANFNEHRVV